MNAFRILVALVFPPLGVFLKSGLGWAFWVNVPLTVMGYVPGIVHAFWII